MRWLLAALSVIVLFAGCTGKHYWQAPERELADFQRDSPACIQETITKDAAIPGPRRSDRDRAMENLYFTCMWARGWERVAAGWPTERQFRGPEDAPGDFVNPPSALDERGESAAERIAACNRHGSVRPSGCR